MFHTPRVLIKISGEVLGVSGIEADALNAWAASVATWYEAGHKAGLRLAFVVGAGNWLRGRSTQSVAPLVADDMGMLATAMNGHAMRDALSAHNIPCEVFSSVVLPNIRAFDRLDAYRAWAEGKVVIFVGGTGNPLFTTDTAAVLRAVQMEADLLIKATKTDGIYDKDPAKYSDAKKIARLSYARALHDKIAVMDASAFDLAERHALPMVVLNMSAPDAVMRAVKGEAVGTWVGAA